MKKSWTLLLVTIVASSIAKGQISFSETLQVGARSYSENQEHFFRLMDATEMGEEWLYDSFLPGDPPCVTNEEDTIGYFHNPGRYVERLRLSKQLDEVKFQDTTLKHYDVYVTYYSVFEWGSNEPRNNLRITERIYKKMLCNYEHDSWTQSFEVVVELTSGDSWERFKDEVSDAASFRRLVGSVSPIAEYEIVKRTNHKQNPPTRFGILIRLSPNPHREGGIATIRFEEFLNSREYLNQQD